MRKAIVLVFLLALMLLALGVAPAFADVHPVAQAGCAADGVASGAIASRHAIGEEGRPAAPIPVVASDGKTKGKAGAATPTPTKC